MAHVRDQIRSALLALLDDLTTTEDRAAAEDPYDVSRLPALRVQTLAETVDEEKSVLSCAQTYRNIELDVVTYAATLADSEAIAVEVEEAIAADNTLGGLCETVDYTGADFEVAGEPDKPVYRAQLHYRAEYSVSHSDVETALT